MKGKTLQVNGRELKIAKVPTEDQLFEVNPLAIDKKIFQEEREDAKHERTRQLILEAFAEVQNNPEKYGRKFYTLNPKKNWDYKKTIELKFLAYTLGTQMSDWVHQSLEWAQRITNGETWDAICNEADTCNWCRAVIWKNGFVRLVGGTRKDKREYPATNVGEFCYFDYDTISDAVPSVMVYENS